MSKGGLRLALIVLSLLPIVSPNPSLSAMQKQLFRELFRKTLFSCALFLFLFAVLYLIEWFLPSLKGQLLQWDNAAFVVGIPASVVGVAYVLTIKNPQNYTGFYGGILMALLLSCQFFLQGNFDLVFLQLCVFIPFMAKSIVEWKRALRAQDSQPVDNNPFVPQYLHGRALLWTLVAAIGIVVLDYVLATLFIQHDAWDANVLLKLCSGMMIASSTLANFWLIYQKIDAWIWWVVYSASGMVLYVLISNIFSLLLFTVFLIVNGSAMIAWMRMHRAGK